MKKLLFILMTLIIVTNFSYASFPVTGSNAEILSTIVSEDTEKDEPSLLEAILMGVLVISILGFASYFLIRHGGEPGEIILDGLKYYHISC